MSESRSAPAISSQFFRDELLATIARHIEIDPKKLSVKMDR
jgi:septum formation topological specificity factor MinE